MCVFNRTYNIGGIALVYWPGVVCVCVCVFNRTYNIGGIALVYWPGVCVCSIGPKI